MQPVFPHLEPDFVFKGHRAAFFQDLRMHPVKHRAKLVDTESSS
jgi:hypothetical protein